MGTRHGKQDQFAPAFAEVLGAYLVTPPDLDTDPFGTFTGEIDRPAGALQAARAKAGLAIAVSGLPLALASEATYGPLPGSGWIGHEEILLFRDEELGIEVLEGHRTTAVPGTSHRVSGFDEVPASLLAGLPAQALIVRRSPVSGPISGPIGGPAGGIVKGITDTGQLKSAIRAAARLSPDRSVLVEPDLRAHHNPSRRRVLVDLAHTLARRLATRCPDCGTPGFGRLAAEPGLPCRTCAAPTALTRTEIHACVSCAHRLSRPVAGRADPVHCPQCNP